MTDCQHQPLEETPHLAPALTAVILGIVAPVVIRVLCPVSGASLDLALAADQAMIERDGKLAPVKNQGTALQQAALDTNALLPVYGSSELVLHTAYTRPFHPTNLFRDQPTGFRVFPVGKAQSTCLIMLEKLAAVGPRCGGGNWRSPCRPPGFSIGPWPGPMATLAISLRCTPESWLSIPG